MSGRRHMKPRRINSGGEISLSHDAYLRLWLARKVTLQMAPGASCFTRLPQLGVGRTYGVIQVCAWIVAGVVAWASLHAWTIVADAVGTRPWLWAVAVGVSLLIFDATSPDPEDPLAIALTERDFYESIRAELGISTYRGRRPVSLDSITP